MQMRPAAARSIEPASVMPGQTESCMRDLLNFYKITGDRKYLERIPEALEWLENSYLPEDHTINDRVTHATFYEIGTNKPLYAHCEGTGIENGRCWVDYSPENLLPYYGMQLRIDVPALRREYERVNALSPEDAMQEWQARRRPGPAPKVNLDRIRKIIEAMDMRGAWVQEITITDFEDVVHNPPRRLEGISTGSFISNMNHLINYLGNMEAKK